MQIQSNKIRNILVVRNDRFGEFLLNIPTLRALKETFINARVIVIVNPYVSELATSIPFIDEVIEWGRVKHSLSEKLNLITHIRKKNIDIAIMLNPSKEFNIISFLAGIPIRVGYACKLDFLLNYKMEDEKYLGEKHEIEYNLDLVGLVGAETNNKTLSLNIINDDMPQAGQIKNYDTLVAIHPWTSDPIKQWPIENFVELAKKLVQRYMDLKIIIVGGNEESLKSQCYFAELKNNIIDYTGRTTLKELAALLKKCKLLISGDSGPVHLACCVGTPVIALFRDDIPGKSAKRWGPWGDGHTVIEKHNLSDISVDEVFANVKKTPF